MQINLGSPARAKIIWHITIVFTILIALASGVLLPKGTNTALADDLVVTRQLPSTVSQGQTFDVTITFATNIDEFGQVGLEDQVPSGWTVDFNKDWCSPTASDGTVSSSNIVKYIWIGNPPIVNPFNVVYKVTVPLDASLGNYTFAGTLGYHIGGGDTISVNIVGNSQVEVIPAKLAFTTQPGSSSTAGAACSTQPVVTLQDTSGTTLTNLSGLVTLAITSGTGTLGAVLSGTTIVNASGGVATFTGLSIDKAGTGYTLTAASTGLTSATSTAFDVVPGPAAKLVFTTQPSSSNGAGTAFSTQPVVTVQDVYGNTVTSFSAEVTLAITSGTGTTGAVISGTKIINVSSGVATFADLSVDLLGTGYTFMATSGTLLQAISTAFNIVPGPATKLVFTTQPSSSNTAGTAFGTQPVVQVQDALGNILTDSSTAVTLAITSGAGTSGAVLLGTTPVNAVNGVATFTDLNIRLAGNGYTLTATGNGLSDAISTAFNIVPGPATKLAFTTQPSSSNTAGTAFSIQPVIQIQDAYGNTVNSTAPVTIVVTTGTGTSGAVLLGATTVNAINSVATFSGLKMEVAGSGYTFTANSGTLLQAISTAFNIVPGPATKLAFTTQPSSSNGAGTAFNTQPVATVQDALGNTINSTASVTIVITTGTGTSGAVLLGTTPVNAVNGVATFTDLNIRLAGNGYTLTATSNGLSDAISTALNIVPGPASKLAFTIQPSINNMAGSQMVTQPAVTVQDIYGNTVTSTSNTITLAITSGSGTTGAVLSGTKTIIASSGVAIFSNLSINLPHNGFTLTATSNLLTEAISIAFNVAGTATRLAFTTQPSASNTAGTAYSTQPVVTVQDALGSTVITSNAAVTVAISSGTGISGATLSGTLTVNASNGVATFAGLSIDKAGTGYTLTATSTGLTSSTCTTLNIGAGTAAKLAFTTQPSSSNTAGIAFSNQPVVQVQDAYGNLVTLSTAPVSLAITTGTGTNGAVLAGTTTLNTVSGVVTFSGLSINLVGTGYTLMASSTGLTSATSSIFKVVSNIPTILAFNTQPSTSNTTGTTFNIQPVVMVYDAYGNLVTSSTATVSLSITTSTGTSGAVLMGTITMNAVSGVATFSGLSINMAGTGYTLTATSTGLTSAISIIFSVTTPTTNNGGVGGGGGGGVPIPARTPTRTPTQTATPIPSPTPITVNINIGGTVSSMQITSAGVVQQAVTITSTDKDISITIPAGDTVLTQEGKLTNSMVVTSNTSPPVPPADKNFIGLAYTFEPSGLTFNPPMTLVSRYDPATLPEGVNEEDLQLAFYNTATSSWETLTGEVDTVNHKITANVAHFTTFAVIAPLPTPIPTPTTTPTIAATPTPTPTPTPTISPTPTPSKSGNHHHGLRWWMWLMIVIGILLVLAVVWLWPPPKSRKKYK